MDRVTLLPWNKGGLKMRSSITVSVPALPLILCFFCAVPGVSAQYTTYGVTVDVANAPALLKAVTYSFVAGQPVYDRRADNLIINAIDREMIARGVTKVASGPSDIVVTYLSVRRTDVDLKSKPSSADGTLPEYPVGTLVVVATHPVDRQKKLFSGRIDTPLDLDPATFETTINAAISAIFAKYPRKVNTR
jgi:Domain of unknown function (DUF4136)